MCSAQKMTKNTQKWTKNAISKTLKNGKVQTKKRWVFLTKTQKFGGTPYEPF